MFRLCQHQRAIAIAAICAAAIAGSATAGCASAPSAEQAPHFSRPLAVGNTMFPLRPGTEFLYRGTLVEGGKSTTHSVTFTVTDLTKTIGGVSTVVAWDRDFEAGELTEQELAFFAQDDRGNVWNFGEYPEEFANGKFQGAPDTWIRGAGGAYGGVHMLARPAVGARYREGLVPKIEFNDMSRVTATGQKTCVPAGCYRRVLKVTEWSPNDPGSGNQLKYYAPGVGLVRVGARGGDAKEFLTLVAIRHLDGPQLAAVRTAALTMERRAYHISKIYRGTRRVVPR
ncbi:MAG: hypothetical protein ACTHJW_03580 [Streptosporangiaceae bacterium]